MPRQAGFCFVVDTLVLQRKGFHIPPLPPAQGAHSVYKLNFYTLKF